MNREWLAPVIFVAAILLMVSIFYAAYSMDHSYGSEGYPTGSGGIFFESSEPESTASDPVNSDPIVPETTDPMNNTDNTDVTQPVETQPEETQPDETRPEETRPKETQPDETQPEETRPNETQPDETQPEETQPDETEPDETQPEETEPTDPTDPTDPAQEVTFEDYLAMTPEEQQAFYESFATPEDFIAWYTEAEAIYKEEQDKNKIEGDGSLDIGDIIGGQG